MSWSSFHLRCNMGGVVMVMKMMMMVGKMMVMKMMVAPYHLLRHLLRDVLVQVKQELNGVVVLVLPLQLLGVVDPEPQLQSSLDAVVVLGQNHVHAVVLLEERVLQQVLDGVPAAAAADR